MDGCVLLRQATIGRPRQGRTIPNRRCKSAPIWVLRICIGVFRFEVVTADERCSPLRGRGCAAYEQARKFFSTWASSARVAWAWGRS